MAAGREIASCCAHASFAFSHPSIHPSMMPDTTTHTNAEWLQGGNDYEIFTSERTQGHTVTSPDDTRTQCTALFINKA
jgi:hypothetical protein